MAAPKFWTDDEAIAAGLYDRDPKTGQGKIQPLTGFDQGGTTDTPARQVTVPDYDYGKTGTGIGIRPGTGTGASGSGETMGEFFNPETRKKMEKLLGPTPLSPSMQKGDWTAIFAEYFVRAVIIILGFIFIAVGLYMFGNRQPVVQAVAGAVLNRA